MSGRHFLLMLAVSLALFSCGLKRNLSLPKSTAQQNSSGSGGQVNSSGIQMNPSLASPPQTPQQPVAPSNPASH